MDTHSDYFGPRRPAVSVKVYTTIRDAFPQFAKDERPDPRFTLDWIEENISDDHLDAVFWNTCEWEFECLDSWATGRDDDPLFPDDDVSLSREGRSGGWVVVDGLPEIEDWDAIRLARWRKFERIARESAAGIPYQMLGNLYINEFEIWADEQADESVSNAELPIDLYRP